MTVLLAVIWPAKVISVYFLGCGSEIADAIKAEWSGRKKYTGWDR